MVLYNMNVAACVLLINLDGLILGVSRKDNSHAFGLPGGKANSGEEPECTAKRECLEETGLEVDNLRLIFADNVPGKDSTDYFTYCYLVDFTGTFFINSNDNETGKVAWLSREELISGPFGIYNQKVFQYYDSYSNFNSRVFANRYDYRYLSS